MSLPFQFIEFLIAIVAVTCVDTAEGFRVGCVSREPRGKIAASVPHTHSTTMIPTMIVMSLGRDFMVPLTVACDPLGALLMHPIHPGSHAARHCVIEAF